MLLTWGDGDIRVLIDNYKYLNGIDIIPFLSYYADIQAYIQSVLGTPKSRQIGLSTAAQELGIDESSFSHHRAYDDSLLSAECLKKVLFKRRIQALYQRVQRRVLCAAYIQGAPDKQYSQPAY